MASPFTSYKFWYIKREGGKDDKEFITEVAVRFFEGDIKDVDVIVNFETREKALVKQYVRSKQLQSAELSHLSVTNTRKESNGNDCVVYTSKDFGVIREEKELVEFLNKELAKDITRTPIEAQTVKQ